MIDLDAIKARLAAATPGPFDVVVYPDTNEHYSHIVVDLDGYDDQGFRRCESVEFTATDAELIANAPTDIAALIAEVERLQHQLDRYQEPQAAASDARHATTTSTKKATSATAVMSDERPKR